MTAPICNRARQYLLKCVNDDRAEASFIFYILDEENIVEVTFKGVTLDEVSLHIGAAYISRIRCLNKSRNLIFIRVMMSYISRKQLVRSLFEP